MTRLRWLGACVALSVLASATIPCGGAPGSAIEIAQVAAPHDHAGMHGPVDHGSHHADSDGSAHAHGAHAAHEGPPLRVAADSGLRLEPVCACGCDGAAGGPVTSPVTRLPSALFVFVAELPSADRAPAWAAPEGSVPDPPARSIERVPIV